MEKFPCVFRTLSLSLLVLLLLGGFVSVYYEQHILLHIAALFLAARAILPIYDRHRECRKSDDIRRHLFHNDDGSTSG
jgi:hypothetical protein